MSPSRVRSLSEHAFKVIIANINSITSLGSIPYRVAKPILEGCTPVQLAEIERNSPHLKEEDQEIWRAFCIREFLHVRDAVDDPEYKPPKSWRKYYLTCLQEKREMEDQAASRIRDKYQALEAQKKERQLIFTDTVHPMKRRKIGASNWMQNAGSKPKTLFEKARMETKKITSVYSASRSGGSSNTTSSNAFRYRQPQSTTSTPSIRSPPMIDNKAGYQKLGPAYANASRSSSNTTLPIAPAAVYDPHLKTIGVVPGRSQPVRSSTSSSQSDTDPANPSTTTPSSVVSPASNSTSPPRPFPSRPPKDVASSLFMPKSRAYSQLSSRASSVRQTPSRA